MASGIVVLESGRILVSLFFWIGKRVTILLPIFFYHKLAQSLLTMGLGRVVTPPDYNYQSISNLKSQISNLKLPHVHAHKKARDGYPQLET